MEVRVKWSMVVSLLLGQFCLGSDINKEVINGSGLDNKPSAVPRVEEVRSWGGFPQLGQVSAVAMDGDGNLHIFHRGGRSWDAQTFDRNDRLTNSEQGPIANDTVLVVDPDSGDVLYSWGSNKFYMPHGLTVDRHGNSWVTDVGLHQVLKFSREHVPLLELGEALVSGGGRGHFCKPTDVAVTAAGFFFVSDGYCNSRILMFTQAGRLITEIGAKDGLQVPHSLVLSPEHGAVCTADRENSRIVCYSAGTDATPPGLPLAAIRTGRVYGIDVRGGQLFAVNGQDRWERSQSVSSQHGLIIDIETGTPRAIWGPDKGFSQPHDLAVSPDGKYVFVAETDTSSPKRVYKFTITD